MLNVWAYLGSFSSVDPFNSWLPLLLIARSSKQNLPDVNIFTAHTYLNVFASATFFCFIYTRNREETGNMNNHMQSMRTQTNFIFTLQICGKIYFFLAIMLFWVEMLLLEIDMSPSRQIQQNPTLLHNGQKYSRVRQSTRI
mgnify:CR=1 FL=1